MQNHFDSIKREAIEILSRSKGSHDWDHTERVYKLALRIGEKVDANLNIIGLAAILHDIARREEGESCGKVCHAELGAIMARKILERHGLKEDAIEEISHCIQTHRFRGNKSPKTLEAKILFDADKLDSMGAVGIGRAFLFSGEHGARLHNKNVDLEKTEEYSREDTPYREYLAKLRHLKDKMQTEEGGRMAESRHNFMEKFFERLNQEVDGLC
ncbi:HD domain-containing protein [Candidatus Parcubacteria bacterium]|nr:MAG: HD domain-containing protein [Candidatus Parcubacteria bacterium]